jgi:hypothetical protein
VRCIPILTIAGTFEFVAGERPGVVAEKGRLNFAPVGFVPKRPRSLSTPRITYLPSREFWIAMAISSTVGSS